MTEVDWSKTLLTSGAHAPPSLVELSHPETVEACAMERVYLKWALRMGWDPQRIIRDWTDQADCTCASVGALLRSYNDRCGEGPAADQRRTEVLGPLLDLAIGTRSTKEAEQLRQWLAADWSLRVATPRLLRAADMAKQAERLEALVPITSAATMAKARAVICSVRDVAYARRADAWQRIRANYTVGAVAVAAWAAWAAVAWAAWAAAEAAGAVAGAVAGAGAVEAAGAGSSEPEVRRIFDAAHQAQLAGGDYGACLAAARKVADEVFAGRGSPFAALRDELDAGFADLVRRMCALN